MDRKELMALAEAEAGVTGFRRLPGGSANAPDAATVYDAMFAHRRETYPEALTLQFWSDHPVTRAALTPGVLGDSVLDCGCGTGEISIHLARAGHQVTGYDLSPYALHVAQEHLAQEHADVQQRVQLVLGTEGSLPFEACEFDSILISHVLEHIAHPTPLLRELARVLKPGGSLLVFTPREHFFDDPTHAHHFTLEQLRELLLDYFDTVDACEIDERRQLYARCSNSAARSHPRIICQMRIKNEARWLKDVLDSIARVADGIVILDDGSTDATPQICSAHPAVAEYRYQPESSLDEARDKNLLLKLAIAHDPDWLLCMDGDELFECGAAARLFKAIESCPSDVSTVDLLFLYMWNDLRHYRSDGIYGEIWHHRLFSLLGQNVEHLSFNSSSHGGNLHCESVPGNLLGQARRADVSILHLGYMHPEDRHRKYEWYHRHDPHHAQLGYYEHLLDQPGMTIDAWRDRPRPRFNHSLPSATAIRQKLQTIWS